MSYQQLTLRKRYHISALLQQGMKQKDIALEIGVHPSTICRELKRNIERKNYTPKSAQQLCFKRHKAKKKRNFLTKQIERYIRKYLKQDWSPEQICGRMKLDINVSVSHESVYRYIYSNKLNGGRLYTYLRHKNKKYHKRSNEYKSRGLLIDRVVIDKRLAVVEKRSRIGDLEIDTVIGKNHIGALVTVVDRKSKFSFIRLLS